MILKKGVLGFTLVLSIVLGTAQAETAIKIAMVNFQQALNRVEQAQKAKASLKKDFDAKQKKLDLQQDELKRLREEIEKQRLVLSASELQGKEESFSRRYMELQKNLADYRTEITQKEAQFTGQILLNLRKICEDLGKEKGYALIVETSQDAVLYADAKEDLTDEVVKRYNKKFTGTLEIK